MSNIIYYARCPVCFQRVRYVDSYSDKISKWDKAKKQWATREFDPDWCITRHIQQQH